MVRVIIDDNVLDITSLLKWHPGGEYCLKSNHNRDVTDIFHTIHSNASYQKYITGKKTLHLSKLM